MKNLLGKSEMDFVWTVNKSINILLFTCLINLIKIYMFVNTFYLYNIQNIGFIIYIDNISNLIPECFFA